MHGLWADSVIESIIKDLLHADVKVAEGDESVSALRIVVRACQWMGATCLDVSVPAAWMLACGVYLRHHPTMSTLALEIDRTLQQLDAATASRLERLVRDALALVKREEPAGGGRNAAIRFPLVQGARPITSEDVARLQDEA